MSIRKTDSLGRLNKTVINSLRRALKVKCVQITLLVYIAFCCLLTLPPLPPPLTLPKLQSAVSLLSLTLLTNFLQLVIVQPAVTN